MRVARPLSLRGRLSLLLPLCLLVLPGAPLHAEPIAVRFPAGTLHAFVVLRSDTGAVLAGGDAVQTLHGSRVTLRLTLKFKDGSLQQETSVFTQAGTLRLVSDRLVQRGPSFPHPLERLIDMPTGNVTVTTPGKDGQRETHTEHQDLPPDLVNGIFLPLVFNLPASLLHGVPLDLPYAAPTARFRVVHLHLEAEGRQVVKAGPEAYQAEVYRAHVSLGGLAGVVAPLIGKQPEDALLVRLGGEAPAFLRMDCQLYEDGPVWRLEQVSASFPARHGSAKKR